MSPCRFRLAFALLFAACLHLPASAQQPLLPEEMFPQLEGILRHAATQSPRMISRGLDLEMADATRDAYRAGLYPSIAGTYRIIETRDERADQPEPFDARKVYYDVSLNQAVFHWGSVMNNARIGDIQQNIARGNYREAYRLYTQEIRSQYLQLIIKKRQVERTRYHLHHVRELLKVAEDRMAKRAISEGELALAKLNVEQAELGFDRMTDDFDSSRGYFSRIAGLATTISADQVPEDIPLVEAPADAFQQPLAAALGAPVVSVHALQNVQHLIDQEALFYKIHKVRLYPKLSFSMGANQDEQSFTINTAQRYRLDSLYAGFTVSWQIFDGFAARAAKRSSLARRRQLENDLRMVNENTKASLQSQTRQLSFAARAMTIADRNVNGAEGLLKARIEDQKNGRASESDVRVSELAVIEAKINAGLARVDYLSKASELRGLLLGDPALAHLPQE